MSSDMTNSHDCANCDNCMFETSNTIPTDLHEIHVTVESEGNNSRFIDVCNANNIKPIVIMYTSNHKETCLDPMTSLRTEGPCQDVATHASKIAQLLTKEGFNVLRTKIETTPNNAEAQTYNGYYESHLAVKTHLNFEGNLRHLVSNYRFDDNIMPHISTNAFKMGNATKTIMITHRRTGVSLEKFNNEVNTLRNDIEKHKFNVDRIIVEYCWYDTNLAHDDSWMNNIGEET
jgi:hypothetical protein|tara:strand:- start:264 stop:959 length:696 start_codon:yes stop_codon:yes gene_type:complete